MFDLAFRRPLPLFEAGLCCIRSLLSLQRGSSFKSFSESDPISVSSSCLEFAAVLLEVFEPEDFAVVLFEVFESEDFAVVLFEVFELEDFAAVSFEVFALEDFSDFFAFFEIGLSSS